MTRAAAPDAATIHVRYLPPFDWIGLLVFFQARAIEGVEEVEASVYRRTLVSNRHAGTIEVCEEPEASRLLVRVSAANQAAAASIVRRAFDTDVDPRIVVEHLARDDSLARVVARRPGLRVPGCWDRFELAVRAILGQQISVVAARRLAGRLVRLCGGAAPSTIAPSSLSHLFPTPADMLVAELDRLGMPAARRAALRALATAAVAEPTLFEASRSIEETVARLRGIAGIGEWTAQYIAMRASREPDAFPATDVGLLRGAAVVFGARPTPRELLRRAEKWRPWRAYAAQHLWAVDAAMNQRMTRAGQ